MSIAVNKVEYLGHILSSEEVKPKPSLEDGTVKAPDPKDMTNLDPFCIYASFTLNSCIIFQT